MPAGRARWGEHLMGSVGSAHADGSGVGQQTGDKRCNRNTAAAPRTHCPLTRWQPVAHPAHADGAQARAVGHQRGIERAQHMLDHAIRGLLRLVGAQAGGQDVGGAARHVADGHAPNQHAPVGAGQQAADQLLHDSVAAHKGHSVVHGGIQLLAHVDGVTRALGEHHVRRQPRAAQQRDDEALGDAWRGAAAAVRVHDHLDGVRELWKGGVPRGRAPQEGDRVEYVLLWGEHHADALEYAADLGRPGERTRQKQQVQLGRTRGFPGTPRCRGAVCQQRVYANKCRTLPYALHTADRSGECYLARAAAEDISRAQREAPRRWTRRQLAIAQLMNVGYKGLCSHGRNRDYGRRRWRSCHRELRAANFAAISAVPRDRKTRMVSRNESPCMLCGTSCFGSFCRGLSPQSMEEHAQILSISVRP